ncbi:MAG TPA: hypothetical protein VF424_10865, partial [Vicinamibacterales bacterium]
VQLYFRSVGRNAKLLLNVPPTRAGLLHETDTARLAAFHDWLREAFARDVAAGRRVEWQRTGERTATAEIDLGRSLDVTFIRLEEPIERGQTVARYSVAASADRASWRVLSRGTTIGYARLDRVEAAAIRFVRVTIEDAIAAPDPIRVRIY